MKKLICILLALTMLLGLTACGSEPDPNCGVYVAESATMMGVTVNVTSVFKGGFTLELKKGGIAVLSYDGETARLKWSLDGDKFTAKASDGELTGTLSNGVMTLENVLDSGMDLRLVNKDYVAPQDAGTKDTAKDEETAEPAETTEPTETTEPAETTEPLAFDEAWWTGKWYGWRVATSATGSLEELANKAWDVVGEISFDGEQGELRFWDYEETENDAVLTAAVRAGNGLTESGSISCLGGSLFGSIIPEGAFTVDPAADPTSVIDHMITITAHYQDPDVAEDTAEISFFLRPWGMEWEDVREADTSDMIYEDMMPIAYDDWYLAQIGKAPAKVEDEPEATPAPAAASGDYTIADEVLVDDDNCTVTILSAEKDDWGVKLKVYCENKTDKTIRFTIGDAAVNGYMADVFWLEDISAGKKSNDEISISSSSLEKIGVTSVDEFFFTLRVYDSEDWSADDLVKERFTLYPTGLSADTVKVPERKTASGEQVLLDNDDLCFVILSTENDDIWGYTLHAYLENKTDKVLMYSWNNVSVNGFMIDPYWASEVAPGMRSYSDIRFANSDFEDNGITEVEEIEFSLRVYDSEDWLADNVYEDTLSYKP